MTGFFDDNDTGLERLGSRSVRKITNNESVAYSSPLEAVQRLRGLNETELTRAVEELTELFRRSGLLLQEAIDASSGFEDTETELKSAIFGGRSMIQSGIPEAADFIPHPLSTETLAGAGILGFLTGDQVWPAVEDPSTSSAPAQSNVVKFPASFGGAARY